ncbi:cilia- and flagella-associated protein 161 isoform X2 [Erinaceus europaeus]|uniref:Cilia- and flagella-associated protein 161 isoform X2 n=1 Tax=Erinaceus europaeus TaxID=9365 RepID=A0ABM3WG95_ERIEU|nr:cilia- and flagella-associated protein 161 isoform X2 [Erinaceus europaeus]
MLFPCLLCAVSICPRGPEYQERMRDFLDRRERGQLLIQHSRWLQESLLTKMQLSVSEDGYVHFGDSVMLVNLDARDQQPGEWLAGDLSLSVTPDALQAHLGGQLELPCGLSAAPTRTPLGRNTFLVLGAGSEAAGQVLRYGQHFCLGTSGGFKDKLLFLSSDHRSLNRSAPLSWLQAVALTDERSFLSCWQAACPDPQLRLEYEGLPVPASTCLLLTHSHTNRGLAVHRHLTLRTYFGREAEVAAHTHLDSHRVEQPQNHWLLVTGSPRPGLATMLDVSPPPLPTAAAQGQ